MENWILSQNQQQDHSFYTTIFSLGNGYMGARAFDEEEICDYKYELCTYIAGIFEYFSPQKTDMVNTPNYWKMNIYIDGERFSLIKGKVINYQKKLNMRLGTLSRSVLWENGSGKQTLIETIRFLSLDDVHCAIMKVNITPVNYSGLIRIETGIDADVKNNIIDDDQMKTDENIRSFLDQLSVDASGDGPMTITLKTRESHMEICEGFDIEFTKNGEKVDLCKQNIEGFKYIGKELKFSAEQGGPYSLIKYIGVWTSRDVGASALVQGVKNSISEMKKGGFDKALSRHSAVWDRKWKVSDICIEGDDKLQKSIRYNIFQLIQTNAENDPYVNIGARGIMHGRYKGCYFWDTEILMFPFYLYTNPNAAKNLLMYRYNTLAGAEENARRQNLEGARFAWMSAIDGLDQCDTWDIGLSEVHITADIAYAVNQYFEATSDIEFIRDYGLEILIKTARYWKSRFSYDRTNDKYNLLFIKGPNEYGGVINNNLYTVMMAANNMEKAIQFIECISEKYPNNYKSLIDKISFKVEEVACWKEILKKLVINYDEEKSLYLEDDNILKLEPLNLSEVKEGDQPLYKKLCFDRLQRYRVLKQADVILLMLLLPQKFSMNEKVSAWNFYEPITTHDSSLSYGTHAEFAARINLMEQAYTYLVKSVNLDLDNIMGNSSKEGIHFAALGSSWQAIVKGFAGLELVDGQLSINPTFMPKWKKLSFKFYYKQCLLKITISEKQFSLIYEEGKQDCVDVTVFSKQTILKKGMEFRTLIV